MNDTLCNFFGFSNTTSLGKVSGGVFSNNVTFTSGGKKYFLKKYKYMSVEDIQNVHKVMSFFKAHDIPITLPIKTTQNDTLFSYNSGLYSLFPFVEGTIISRDCANTNQARALGVMLAKMHLLSKGKIPYGFEAVLKKEKPLNTRLEKIERIKNLIHNKRNLDVFDNKVLDILSLKEQLLQTNWDTFNAIVFEKDTLIHGDFHVENVFFNDANEILDVFDFDKAKLQYREAEILWCLFISFYESSFEKNSIEIESFLKGYNSIYEIEPHRFSNAIKLYFFGIFKSVWAEEEYYLDNNQRVKFIIEADLKRINYLNENLNSFTDRLLRYL